ncbi:ATP synthase f chain, mitochondrial precursor [Pleurotus pulmonarius]|nr:ATP synthase f chain, mitochondrial precursor [Pleurotus pulmonarius]KAF4591022.1 ATP synthase f chain, mitochondrial precursor [Pleurotus pulmonarius]
MHASLVRRQLGGLIPPKIASPGLLSGGSGDGLSPLVNFYSKLPKGPAPASTGRGLKAKFFSGSNASGAPIVATIFGIFALGYTIDYQMHLSTHSCRLSSRQLILISVTQSITRITPTKPWSSQHDIGDGSSY